MGSSSEWKMPFTPAVRAYCAISEPSRRVPLSPFMTPAKPGRRTAMTTPLDFSAPEMTLAGQSLKTDVTSTGSNAASLVPLSFRMSLTLTSIFCLLTSFLTKSGSILSSWTPLISMRAPSGMEMFRSSRMVPSPLLTLLVALSRVPILRATSMTSSGVLMSGAVATSMRGMPSLSVLQTTSVSVASMRLQASSSRQTERMPILLPRASTEPSTATREVLWKPEVLEPSTTILRMNCTSSMTLAPMSSLNMREVSMASALTAWGGSSSSSTRHVVQGQDWERKPYPLRNWARAARSISPISEVVGLRRR